MIPRASDLAQLSPANRAKVIYSAAQSELQSRLWRAALGDGDNGDKKNNGLGQTGLAGDSLLELLGGRINGQAGGVQGCNCGCACACHQKSAAPASFADDCIEELKGAIGSAAEQSSRKMAATMSTGATFSAASGAVVSGLSLGANTRFASALTLAEARTGIPATALASIVDAEAAKTSDGSWNTMSRNPRSSAAGLGQFLSGTWEQLAETSGTWLNQVASERGWLDGRGKVLAGARSELLSLRYDGQASILGVADLAKLNLTRLEQSGIRVNTDAETLAKSAYLSHHLGLGDARKFLAGGIEPGRARMLLAAQIGGGAADQRIAAAGNATQAHRQWLLGFIDRRIRPEQFAG
ncbi:peptidoglycan-binding protein [Sphingomonas sp. HITSZ_GF]|uniref:peptidoglycan-binding protein n=1 Tax=Sphingomonas sp. HITSZ_GF TaxID=3037247 RepID=UPI00240E3745|nr:peptidoglycan-binding protein [Sphingomonas sp. HITSZ_GF]MDG2534051.1 peptidoglycan-binding protein [Sphingomonas sp. HITSZ_GF]